jgi:hypothetical protein
MQVREELMTHIDRGLEALQRELQLLEQQQEGRGPEEGTAASQQQEQARAGPEANQGQAMGQAPGPSSSKAGSAPAGAPHWSVIRNMMALRDGAGQPQLSWPQLRAMCLLMFFAGHDTSSSTLALLMWRLCGSPHVMERLREEQQVRPAGAGQAMVGRPGWWWAGQGGGGQAMVSRPGWWWAGQGGVGRPGWWWAGQGGVGRPGWWGADHGGGGQARVVVGRPGWGGVGRLGWGGQARVGWMPACGRLWLCLRTCGVHLEQPASHVPCCDVACDRHACDVACDRHACGSDCQARC